ncbi:MAG: AAA family ATPase, partial [Ferruginibacter sp.]
MNLPPLAERMRPDTLDALTGQLHLTGKGSILRTAIENGKVPSMILWGPPGVGKTTIANIIANSLQLPFYTISAISSGVKEIREIIEESKEKKGAILFIDEIHRFNKGQQDALLGAVEKGIITLIGATTENPSFEVNSALLSRCQVYVLKPLNEQDQQDLLKHAIETDIVLKKKNINLQETSALITISGGDARKLLNLLELVTETSPKPSPKERASETSKLNGPEFQSENLKAPSPLERAGSEVINITDNAVMEIAQQRIA